MDRSEPPPLTADERRLLMFFRALTPRDQSDLLRAAGERTFLRCFPTKRIVDFVPSAEGVDPHEIASGNGFLAGNNDRITIAEIICEGCFQDDISSQLFGSEYFDDPEVDPTKLRIAIEAFEDQDFHDFDRHEAAFRSYIVTSYIRDWRTNIASACQRVTDTMARSTTEADAQRIPVPDRDEDWIEYVLTIDGERIADELGWSLPGDYDWDLTATLDSLNDPTDPPEPQLSPAVMLRLALYGKLRFLQAHDLLPPNAEQMSEIKALLDWLRGDID